MPRWAALFHVGWTGGRPVSLSAFGRWRAAFPGVASGTLWAGDLWPTLQLAAQDQRHARLLARHRVQEFLPPPEYRAEHVATMAAEQPPAA